MIDIKKYARPKDHLDLEDGIELLADANLALDIIGIKLECMRGLAACAADPDCDPVTRIEMSLLFDKLAREIDEWAQTSTGGIQLLNDASVVR